MDLKKIEDKTIAVCESHVTDIDDARHSETKAGWEKLLKCQ